MPRCFYFLPSMSFHLSSIWFRPFSNPNMWAQSEKMSKMTLSPNPSPHIPFLIQKSAVVCGGAGRHCYPRLQAQYITCLASPPGATTRHGHAVPPPDSDYHPPHSLRSISSSSSCWHCFSHYHQHKKSRSRSTASATSSYPPIGQTRTCRERGVPGLWQDRALWPLQRRGLRLQVALRGDDH